MRSTISAFLVLVAVSILATYAFRVRPKTRREWVYVVIAIAFLAWMLPFMISLRSR